MHTEHYKHSYSSYLRNILLSTLNSTHAFAAIIAHLGSTQYTTLHTLIHLYIVGRHSSSRYRNALLPISKSTHMYAREVEV